MVDCYLDRQSALVYDFEQTSATRIQAIWRAYAARRLQLNMTISATHAQASALRIQTRWRAAARRQTRQAVDHASQLEEDRTNAARTAMTWRTTSSSHVETY